MASGLTTVSTHQLRHPTHELAGILASALVLANATSGPNPNPDLVAAAARDYRRRTGQYNRAWPGIAAAIDQLRADDLA